MTLPNNLCNFHDNVVVHLFNRKKMDTLMKKTGQQTILNT